MKEYVRTGKVDETLGAWLSRMERLREKADYNCSYEVEKEEVEAMHNPCCEIISSVKQLISDK